MQVFERLYACTWLCVYLQRVDGYLPLRVSIVCVCVYGRSYAFICFCVYTSNSGTVSNWIHKSDSDNVTHSVCLLQNNVKYSVGEILRTHKTMKKTTVGDDEMGTASSTLA